MTLAELNAATEPALVTLLGAVYEHSPWVAAAVAGARPFDTVASLQAAMAQAVAQAPPEQQRALVAGHPELGGKLARAGTLEAASAAEQGDLGLDRLSDAEFEQFDRLNTAYQVKFGFPFVIAVKRHTRASVLAAFAARLGNAPAQELATALAEIHAIAGFRLAALFPDG